MEQRRDLGGVLEGFGTKPRSWRVTLGRETLMEFFQNTFEVKSTGLGVWLGLKERRG